MKNTLIAYKVYTYTDQKVFECEDIEMGEVGVWVQPYEDKSVRIFIPYQRIECIHHFAHSYLVS